MDPVLCFGVIGLGRAATSMLPSLAAHPQVRLVAAADPRPEARERFAAQFQADAYPDAEALVRRPDIDAVYIATPHQLHAEHVLLAASHGKHAICEKPMALTLADCARMNAAVDRSGTKLVIGHTHSFDPPILRIREIIHSGELGRLGMIHSWNYTDFLYRPRRPEELDTRLGGGIVFNQVPHQVDTVRLLGGMSPRFFFRGIQEAMVTAFSTSSSNATLPTALKVAEENLKLPAKTSRFVLTIGATANQNGTALYEGVTVLFLAQVYGVHLALEQQVLVLVLCILGGIGTAGVPGGSIPVVIAIMTSVGVPIEGIGLILGVDRLLDMCRTVLNVSGDLAAAVVVSRGERERA